MQIIVSNGNRSKAINITYGDRPPFFIQVLSDKIKILQKHKIRQVFVNKNERSVAWAKCTFNEQNNFMLLFSI